MVPTNHRAGEEESDPRNDDVGVGSPTAVLQLPALEGRQGCLQEVCPQSSVMLWLIFSS